MASMIRINNPGLQASRLHKAIQGILLASALTVSSTPHAQTNNDHASVKRSYHIDSGSLSQALRQFATNSGLLFSAEAKLTDGKTTAGLNGEYTVEEGFKKLLAGTGLTYTFTAEDSVSIKAVDAGSDTSTLPAVKVTGKSVEPNDPYNPYYNRNQSSMASRTDTPIMETPMSVQVVPRAVLDDQQVIDLKDAVQNVSGVQWSPVEGELYENFVIRGFDASGSTSRNGVRDQSATAETANLERVEVLKGPAAMLYGRIEPGGLINRVTKTPLFNKSYYSLQQQFGSFDKYRTTLDATGPINSELAYRFNAAYQTNNSYRDFVGNERVFLAPSVTWKPSDRTEIGLNLEYQYDNLRWDDGIPAIGNRPANVAINTYLGDPISNDKQERQLVDLHWSHEFNDQWKVDQRFVASRTQYRQFNIFPWSLDDAVYNAGQPAGSMAMGLWDSKADRNIYSQNINLIGHLKGFGAEHTLLTGFDFYKKDQAGNQFGPITTGPLADGTAVQNLYNPVYGLYDKAYLKSLPAQPGTYGVNNENWYGVYMQDEIKIWDNWHFMLGGRYEWAEIATYWNGNTPTDAERKANQTSISADKFNPRFGILYQPWKWLSVYGNYAESMGSNGNKRDINNNPLQTQQARQFEFGVKNEFFDGKLNSSVAFFDLVKNNIAAANPNRLLAQQGYANTIGEARSRGIEVDVSGQPTENLNIIANYAWTNTRITKDGGQTLYDTNYNVIGFNANGYQGNQLPLAPKHSSSIWAKYEFGHELLKGLSFGTGVRMASQSQGNPANDYQLPGYVTLNAMTAYKYKLKGSTITAQFNANNILDHRYYFGSDQLDQFYRFNIIPAAPANFMGSIRLEY